MRGDQSRTTSYFQGVANHKVVPENRSDDVTQSRFLLGAYKTTQSSARAPKRHGAFDYQVSTAPLLLRSGARAFTTKLIHNHMAASFNDNMTTPYFRCRVVRRMGSTSGFNPSSRLARADRRSGSRCFALCA